MGLDVYLYDGDERLEAPSDKYPEHTSNKGYLRSSYNSGGFNSVVGQLIDKDMYYIFEPIEPDYENDDDDSAFYVPYTKTHLKAALKRAKEVTSELKEVRPLGVVTESPVNIFQREVKDVDGTEAIRLVNQELDNKEERNPFFGASFSNASGYYFLDEPLKVVGIVKGKSIMNEPCLHMVYEMELDYYIQQAEIIEEFIETAIKADEPRIGWSG